MTREIKLQEKPVSEWTEIEIIVETIKLWSFLAENGDRTKEQYFESDYVPILCGCFLCEYYFRFLGDRYNRLRHKRKIGLSICKEFDCCLKGNSICGFNYNGSAFNIWYESDDRDTRERAAKKIVQAAKRRYKILTGENYHE